MLSYGSAPITDVSVMLVNAPFGIARSSHVHHFSNPVLFPFVLDSGMPFFHPEPQSGGSLGGPPPPPGSRLPPPALARVA